MKATCVNEGKGC